VAGLQTQFDFTLPKGYVDREGRLHRAGTMRLATARDEIQPLRDPRITGPDDPYLTILVLARVITELGTLPAIDVDVVEELFAADLAFLQDLYGIINFGSAEDIEALQRAVAAEQATEPAPAAVAVVASADAIDAASEPAIEPLVESVAGSADASGASSPSLAGASTASPSMGRRRDRIEEVPRVGQP